MILVFLSSLQFFLLKKPLFRTKASVIYLIKINLIIAI